MIETHTGFHCLGNYICYAVIPGLLESQILLSNVFLCLNDVGNTFKIGLSAGA